MRFLKRKDRGPKVYPTRMVVGLGNPGPEYKGTRHNVGFEVVEALARRHGGQIRTSRSNALLCEAEILGVAVAVVKPLTFMNLSGQAVRALARHYNIDPAGILVIADDLDLPVGKVRMRAQGGTGGHNGHKSVSASLGSQEYPRIRIGIGSSGEVVDHVLSRFTPNERGLIEDGIGRSVDAVESWLTDGIDAAMRLANGPGD